jgi:hypothetical protein
MLVISLAGHCWPGGSLANDKQTAMGRQAMIRRCYAASLGETRANQYKVWARLSDALSGPVRWLFTERLQWLHS